MKKLFFIVLICAAVMFSAAVAAGADTGFPDAKEDPAFHLRAKLFDAADAYSDVLELPGYPDEPFYLFLPAGCDRTKLRLTFKEPWMKINGKEIVSGEASDVFLQDGAYTAETPDGAYPLRVVSSAKLPSVYITTESGSLDQVHADKSFKEPAALTVAEEGGVTLDRAELVYIKGRGNTSWRGNEKKSYNIRFKENTDLFGMGKAKKWVLTSNNTDVSLMRNAIAYTAAKLTRIPYTVDFVFVDLYINGVYRGNYMLCEKIGIGDGRVEISDLEKENERLNPGETLSEAERHTDTDCEIPVSWYGIINGPEDITGGYLLEYEYPDAFDTEPCAFLNRTGQCLIVHSPEYATKDEMLYISCLYADFEEALLSANGVNAKGKHFTEYMDTDSFVDALLLYEFSEDSDRGHTSWYLFVPKGEPKFYMGPVWDFDSGMDVPDEELRCVKSFAENAAHGIGKSEDITFIDLLCSHQTVLDAMKERFTALAPAFSTVLKEQTDALFAKNEASANMDQLRWGYMKGNWSDLHLPEYPVNRTEHMLSDLGNLQALIGTRTGEVTEPDDHTEKPYVFIFILIAAAAVAGSAVLIGRKNRSKKAKNSQ